jgi:hypothetical protein
MLEKVTSLATDTAVVGVRVFHVRALCQCVYAWGGLMKIGSKQAITLISRDLNFVPDGRCGLEFLVRIVRSSWRNLALGYDSGTHAY